MKIEKLNLDDFVQEPFTLTGLFLINDHWIEGKLNRYVKNEGIYLRTYDIRTSDYSNVSDNTLKNIKLYVVLD